MVDEELAVGEEGTAEGMEEAQSSEEKLMAALKEAISTTRETVGALREKVTVTVPRGTLDERLSEQFAELKREAAIPGFRKGHAPLKLVEKRFGADVGKEMKDQIVTSAYLAAVEKEKLDPLGDPYVWVDAEETHTGEDGKPRTVQAQKLLRIDQALEHMKLPVEGDLSYSFEVELKPEFELPGLDKIRVEKPKVTVEDDDIDTEIDRMRTRAGVYQPVADEPIEQDDLLYADVTVTAGDHVLSDEKNQELAARDLRLAGVPFVGLGDALAGKKRGDTVTVEATVPDDHENLDLRGKTASARITVHEVKRLELAPLDENFLASWGFDSEAELRDAIRRNMESRLDQVIKQKMKEQVAQYLIDNTDLTIPEGLSQRQTDRSTARRMMELYQSGIPEAEIRKAADEMRVKAHDQAVRDLKLFFVCEKIAEQREIKVSEERLNGAIAAMAARTGRRFDRVRDELVKLDGLAGLYVSIRDDLVLEDLLKTAEIVEVERPKKKAGKKPAAKKAAGSKRGAKAAEQQTDTGNT